jgi:hypothetical protein
MEAITIPHVRIPSINIGGICLPGIGAPGSIGKKGLIWPTGMKEHIKAWYDPKKQGITNFDVIESYTEDFTTWRYLDSRGIATITGSTIHITEAKSIQGIVEDNKEPYSDIKILVQGVTADNPLNVRDINGTKAVIDKDGVYEFKDNGLYFGFGFSKVGVVDVTITQLPTSILKDFSGNGNHAYLYGGKGKLNSGMGVYQQDFSKLIISRVDKKQDPFSFTVSGSGGTYLAYMQLGNWNNKAFKILANINAKSDYLHLRFRNNTDAVITSVALKNGENIIPAQNIEGATKAVFEYSLKEGETITITQIPDYPDQLCYGGKMYAVCYGFPILTDYTVMAERTWFENNGNRVFITKGNIWPNCAFVFEKINASLDSETFSFSKSTRIDDLRSKSGVTYQTKQSYNGVPIAVGDSSDGDILLIGGQKSGEYIGCHSAIIVADRSFTEEEINWLKDNWKKI